jgi:hypothetical protein
MKIVINAAYGGFGLSAEALREYNIRAGANVDWSKSISRDDPLLIEIVERMGPEAGGKYARLKVVEIPDGVDWEIEEYDGNEWVSEVHRTWR